MIYIGIDPGKGGGIAALVDAGLVLDVFKMPATTSGIVDALEGILGRRSVEGPVIVTIENVWTSPQMGVTSAGTFMRGFGRLEGVLAAWRIPIELVVPVKWQNALDCRTRGDKNISKARAMELFPALTITHAIADALLIAEYARRLRHPAATTKESRDGKASEGQKQTAEQEPAQRATQGRRRRLEASAGESGASASHRAEAGRADRGRAHRATR